MIREDWNISRPNQFNIYKEDVEAMNVRNKAFVVFGF